MSPRDLDVDEAETAPPQRSTSGFVATVRAAAMDVLAVFGHAVQLLGRHWPVVLAILLAGEAGRYAALWAAVELSDLSGTLGVLTLALGPLSAVSALIIALYALRHSLPSLAPGGREDDRPADDPAGDQAADDQAGDDDAPSARRSWSTVLPVIGSVLVPFLAIYASYGYLRDDVFRFVNEATTDELFGNADVLLGTGEIDVNRTALATGWMAMVVVVVALVLRYGLGVLNGRYSVPGLMWLAAYVEVVWLVTLARTLSAHQEAAIAWLRERSLVQTLADAWHDLVALTGPLAGGIDRVVGWFFHLLGSADALIVIPVAWLTVGAVVYGRQLADTPRTSASHRGIRSQRVVGRVPPPVRRVGRELTSGFTERFGELASGLRRLALAGLAPMLFFTLSFVAAQRLEHVLNLAWRQLLGPIPRNDLLAFSPHTAMISHALGTLVVVCLLGAAIDRVIGRGTRGSAPAAAATTPRRPDSAAAPTTAAPR